MQFHRPSVAAVKIALDVEHPITLGEVKTSIVTLLTAWIAYFAVIALNIQALDRIIIPYLELPLGQALAAQGSFVIFVVALAVLIRHHRHG